MRVLISIITLFYTYGSLAQELPYIPFEYTSTSDAKSLEDKLDFFLSNDSRYRVKVKHESPFIVNEDLLFWTDERNCMYQTKYTQVEVFRIMLVSTRDRNLALKSHAYAQENFIDLVNLSYEQPNYKVKLGVFIDELDAYRVLKKAKYSFPSSFIIKEKMPYSKLIYTPIVSRVLEQK